MCIRDRAYAEGFKFRKAVLEGCFTIPGDGCVDYPGVFKALHDAHYEEMCIRDRLALSPQCGFASTEEGNLVTDADQWSKLALVREIAEEVWACLLYTSRCV